MAAFRQFVANSRVVLRSPFVRLRLWGVAATVALLGCEASSRPDPNPNAVRSIDMPPSPAESSTPGSDAATPANEVAPRAVRRPPRVLEPVATSLSGDTLPPFKPDQLCFSDSFSNVNGAVMQMDAAKKISFAGRGMSRSVGLFLADKAEGEAILKIIEDAETTGADGQPGVFALKWDKLPPQLQYSGFVYMGLDGEGPRLTLPLDEIQSPDDLRRFRMRFRYKAVNTQVEDPPLIDFNARFEPNGPNAYESRIVLGKLTATEAWQQFEGSLGNGENAEKFAAAVLEGRPSSFRLTFSQAGSIGNYFPGDTLHVDDVVLTYDRPESDTPAP